MAQNSYKDKDVLQQFNVTLIPKKEIINVNSLYYNSLIDITELYLSDNLLD